MDIKSGMRIEKLLLCIAAGLQADKYEDCEKLYFKLIDELSKLNEELDNIVRIK